MPIRALSLALALLMSFSLSASGQQVEPIELRLWEGDAPGALGDDEADVPTLTVYKATRTDRPVAAFVVCPGGGYGHLAIDHEGRQVAEWLNGLGITAAVLKYRLGPKYHHPAPIDDAQRALRIVRANASAWHVDGDRIGILGFSAGGHLASTAGTHFDDGDPDADDPIDRLSCRPNLMVLGYPVVAMATEYAHGGSKRNLLGENPPDELVESLSNERMVTADTPPTFIVQTNEDTAVPAENSLLLVMALRKAGVPVEFHLFEAGRHGLGLGSGLPDRGIGPDSAFSAWPGLCATWLRKHDFIAAE